MTTKEAFALVCETIERKLNETIRKWGYTVERDSDASWACWQIAELDFTELVSVTKFDSVIRLESLGGKASNILPQRLSPKRIEVDVNCFLLRVLKAAVLTLAHDELLNILGLDDKAGVLMLTRRFVNPELLVWINEKSFYITFRLNKKWWSWKVTTFQREPVTAIRRPLGENPIPVLCETVKCLGLSLL
jgi:hypothetical protein